MVESSLHSGHFQGVGEVQIQVLQQDRLMFGGATDAAFADRRFGIRLLQAADNYIERLYVLLLAHEVSMPCSLL